MRPLCTALWSYVWCWGVGGVAGSCSFPCNRQSKLSKYLSTIKLNAMTGCCSQEVRIKMWWLYDVSRLYSVHIFNINKDTDAGVEFHQLWNYLCARNRSNNVRNKIIVFCNIYTHCGQLVDGNRESIRLADTKWFYCNSLEVHYMLWLMAKMI